MELGGNQQFASPEEALAHHGIKGQKWGVRRDKTPKPEIKQLVTESITKTTKNGDVLTVKPQPPSRFMQALARHSNRHKDFIEKGAYLDIVDKDGNRVGNGQVREKSKDELNLVWLDIEKSKRGQGYASAVFSSAAEIGKQKGYKKLTLEVPGISPDARHIYEKSGFKVTKEPKNTHDIWGGLTHMEKSLEDES